MMNHELLSDMCRYRSVRAAKKRYIFVCILCVAKTPAVIKLIVGRCRGDEPPTVFSSRRTGPYQTRHCSQNRPL